MTLFFQNQILAGKLLDLCEKYQTLARLLHYTVWSIT